MQASGTRKSVTSMRIAFSWVLLLCGAPANADFVPAGLNPPAPTRELRAAWVATVANIDWPSSNRLDVATQKAQLIAIMDRAADLNLNTIIFQVRPACDALYASKIEPWSEYLTGTMGQPPQPFYDPLAFAVAEAHRRGLELHAWFNPYRARHRSAKSPVAENHISKTRPQLVRQYGGFQWLDPGEPAVQDYSISVVMDVVRRYDIDGVHFDDYFYPYKERDSAGKVLEFPDSMSWARYGSKTRMSRDDWRRENVNAFIRRTYQTIKREKSWVKFGISPFGIWRPGNPPQIKGFDPYSELYADSRKWLASGWVDYFVPQLYWAIAPPEQSFPALLKWWEQQNPRSRILVPGMDSTKVPRSWKPEEIVNQIRIARGEKGVAGHVHWNMRSLMRNPQFDAVLKSEVYGQPAILPAYPWLDRSAPGKPVLRVSGDQVSWYLPKKEYVTHWVLQTRTGEKWNTEILPGGRERANLNLSAVNAVAVRAVDRCGNVGPSTALIRR